MSILSSVTSILGLMKLAGTGVPPEERASTKPDDCGDGKPSKWNDDHSGNDEYSNGDGKDNYSKLSGMGAYPNDGKGDYPEHDGGWKDAKDGEYQARDYCDLKSADHGGTGDTDRSPGEALAKFDFSHGDFAGDFRSHGPDHSGDIHGALASMSCDDALEYAIGLMGPAEHFDVGHFDTATDTSHDTDA
ncbi:MULTISPECIES: hypothetical protein [unclassified Bradyrhizobium]|uniref:hypothetical protein n=1 Tax=unclassified Bradyrhizobium TaxID=2631580 RepID=UPI001CD6659D|nr:MULTISPECIES: hypothetical protein [unclassified Bradyrhizobium]MCA1495192.1 hypothetical protein [Bradyrhizobium sp. NBAIM14]MCA1531000.1 hypothetical protein [Bradyrhizobium sp. NBAIM03]